MTHTHLNKACSLLHVWWDVVEQSSLSLLNIEQEEAEKSLKTSEEFGRFDERTKERVEEIQAKIQKRLTRARGYFAGKIA